MLEYTWTSKGEQMEAYNYIKWGIRYDKNTSPNFCHCYSVRGPKMYKRDLKHTLRESSSLTVADNDENFS